jgi:hypothetical protein
MANDDHLTDPPMQCVTQEMWDEAQRARLLPSGGNTRNAQLTADRLQGILGRIS